MSDEETEEKGGVWDSVKDAFRLAKEDEEGDEGEGEDGEQSEDSGEDGEGEGEKDQFQEAAERVQSLEDDPPKDIADWPDDQAKYETFGVSDEEAYDEGPTMNLGPPALRRFPDGSITIEGEEVDNPDDYKGPPIKGGPTDPDVGTSEVDPEKDEKVGDEGDDSDEDEQSSDEEQASGDGDREEDSEEDDSSEEGDSSEDGPRTGTAESSGESRSSDDDRSAAEESSDEDSADEQGGEASDDGEESSSSESREEEHTG